VCTNMLMFRLLLVLGFLLSFVQSAQAAGWDAGDTIALIFLLIISLLAICAGVGVYARKYGGYSPL